MAQEAVLTLREELRRRRNPDGGWGYASGKGSRIEPTCWSILALARLNGRQIERDVISRWPRQNGWLIDVPGAPVNYAFNALAALTLAVDPTGRPESLRIARQLANVRGLKFEQGKEIRQDNSLQAWPWIDATFSWVEPTSLCLLLFKKLRHDLPADEAGARISVAERMLLDRACKAGGWNYGGSNVYGQELFPYVPTTALALLAMQDRKSDAIVTHAVDWLRKEATSEVSAQAMAMALIALALYKAPIAGLERTVRTYLESNVDRTSTLGLATGLYSLAWSADGEVAFRL